MKHWLARILINRSLDDGTALPDWVADLLTRDARLRHFYAEQEDVVAQLQADAATFSTQNPTAVRFAARQPRSRAAYSALVVSTALAAVIAISVSLDGSPDEGPKIVDAAPSELVPSFEVGELQNAIDRSGQTAGKLTAHVDDVATDFSSTTPKDIGRLTREYVQDAGAIFGRSLAMLDQAGSVPVNQ